jgi:hypothetical protein
VHKDANADQKAGLCAASHVLLDIGNADLGAGEARRPAARDLRRQPNSPDYLFFSRFSFRT